MVIFLITLILARFLRRRIRAKAKSKPSSHERGSLGNSNSKTTAGIFTCKDKLIKTEITTKKLTVNLKTYIVNLITS